MHYKSYIISEKRETVVEHNSLYKSNYIGDNQNTNKNDITIINPNEDNKNNDSHLNNNKDNDVIIMKKNKKNNKKVN
jgi:hypothetical protein